MESKRLIGISPYPRLGPGRRIAPVTPRVPTGDRLGLIARGAGHVTAACPDRANGRFVGTAPQNMVQAQAPLGRMEQPDDTVPTAVYQAWSALDVHDRGETGWCRGA
jgi:hypothetical protein